jgi:heptosyltransferase I
MPALPLTRAPREICLLRLSALGDVCHVVPLLRRLQAEWPQARCTWIIGKLEHKLLGGIEGVEFVVFDKGAGRAGYAQLRERLAGRRFDVLLHLQLALRASLAAALVPAGLRLGFDRARAREAQWLFTNARVAARRNEHVLDSFQGFADALGAAPRPLRWDIPLPESAHTYARQAIPDAAAPTLVISPCSSHALRNWHAAGYAAVADHAVARHGMRVLVCGGRSELEKSVGAEIVARMREPAENLVGRDTLPEFLATLGRAAVLLTPDAGPAHMGAAVGTPVLGLYAATNPARSGPYFSRDWCVDRYAAAARQVLGKTVAELAWTTKIERPGVMDLITVEDVVERLDAVAAAGYPRTPTGGSAIIRA